VDFERLMVNDLVRLPMLENIRQIVADSMGSGTTAEDVLIRLEDATEKPTPVFWEYAFRCFCTINSPPETVNAKLNELLAKARLAKAVALAVQATPLIHLLVSSNFVVRDIIVDPEDVSLPSTAEVGSAELFVDGIRGHGVLTYLPEDEFGPDYIGMDGQFVLCGGLNGTAIDCQVQDFRFWNRALSHTQVRAVQPCKLPDLRGVMGGAFPYGLAAWYRFDGSFENSAPASTYPAAEGRDAASSGFPMFNLDGDQREEYRNRGALGRFARGGRCAYPRCPAADPETRCPLVPSSELRFNNPQDCAAYARLNFCRRAGPSRGRPSGPELDGCHIGAKPRSAAPIYTKNDPDNITNWLYAWQRR